MGASGGEGEEWSMKVVVRGEGRGAAAGEGGRRERWLCAPCQVKILLNDFSLKGKNTKKKQLRNTFLCTFCYLA